MFISRSRPLSVAIRRAGIRPRGYGNPSTNGKCRACRAANTPKNTASPALTMRWPGAKYLNVIDPGLAATPRPGGPRGHNHRVNTFGLAFFSKALTSILRRIRLQIGRASSAILKPREAGARAPISHRLINRRTWPDPPLTDQWPGSLSGSSSPTLTMIPQGTHTSRMWALRPGAACSKISRQRVCAS